MTGNRDGEARSLLEGLAGETSSTAAETERQHVDRLLVAISENENDERVRTLAGAVLAGDDPDRDAEARERVERTLGRAATRCTGSEIALESARMCVKKLDETVDATSIRARETLARAISKHAAPEHWAEALRGEGMEPTEALHNARSIARGLETGPKETALLRRQHLARALQAPWTSTSAQTPGLREARGALATIQEQHWRILRDALRRETIQERGRIAHPLREALKSIGAKLESANALERFYLHCQPGTAAQKMQAHAWTGLTDTTTEALARYANARADAVSQRSDPFGLDARLLHGLHEAREQTPGWRYRVRSLVEIPEDQMHRATCLVAASNAPFDPDNPTFSKARGTLEGTNTRTWRMVQSSACIVPVLLDKSGEPIGHGASANLYRATARRLGGAIVRRTVVASLENGTVVVRPLPPHGGTAEEAATKSSGEAVRLPSTDARWETHASAPESWRFPDDATPAPGEPIFVIADPRQIERGPHANADGGAPFHMHDTHTGLSAHPHEVVIAAAARLGGARPILVLTAEESQGALRHRTPGTRYSRAEKRRLPLIDKETGEQRMFEARLNNLVDRAVKTALDAGAGKIPVAIVPGAPPKGRETLTSTTSPYAQSADPNEAANEENTWHEARREWTHGMRERTRQRHREAPQEPETRGSIRIALLAPREAIETTMNALVQAATIIDQPLTIAIRTHGGDNAAREANTALAKSIDACARSARATPQVTLVAMNARTHPLSTDACDAIAIAGIDPTHPAHRPLLAELAAAARGQGHAPIVEFGRHPIARQAHTAQAWSATEQGHRTVHAETAKRRPLTPARAREIVGYGESNDAVIVVHAAPQGTTPEALAHALIRAATQGKGGRIRAITRPNDPQVHIEQSRMDTLGDTIAPIDAARRGRRRARASQERTAH